MARFGLDCCPSINLPLQAGDPTIDIDIEYFQFGGTYLFDGDNTRPFIALTLGMSQFDPGLTGSDSESFFSASFGAACS